MCATTRTSERVAVARVEDIFGRTVTPAPWLPSEPAIQLALAALPSIGDDTAAEVMSELAMTVLDLREELRGVRTVLSAALAAQHHLHRANVTLRLRVADLARARRRA